MSFEMRLDYQSVHSNDTKYLYKSRRPQVKLRYTSYVLLVAIVLLIFYLCGIFSIIKEESFSEFTYPLELPNLKTLVSEVDRLRIERNITVLNYTIFDEILKDVRIDGIDTGIIKPYNQFDRVNVDVVFNGSKSWFVLDVGRKIDPRIKVTIIVKSAVNYHTKRDSIRNSWKLNKQIGLFKFKTIFIVGNCHSSNPIPKSLSKRLNGAEWTVNMCHDYIIRESLNNGDIIQSTGIDTYHNNTIKTIMTHKWASEQQESDFIVAIDDDYALEVDNLIEYIQVEAMKFYNSSNQYIIQANDLTFINRDSLSQEKKLLFALKELSQQYFYAGYLHYLHRPLRFPTNKFYMSTHEYPFDRYPPFVTGGLIVLSQKFSRHLYLSSFLVKSFKFDDVYLGIIAYKLGVEALHSDNFMCDQSNYVASKPYARNSTSCIGVHDIASEDLVDIWAQKRQGQQSKASAHTQAIA